MCLRGPAGFVLVCSKVTPSAESSTGDCKKKKKGQFCFCSQGRGSFAAIPAPRTCAAPSRALCRGSFVQGPSRDSPVLQQLLGELCLEPCSLETVLGKASGMGWSGEDWLASSWFAQCVIIEARANCRGLKKKVIFMETGHRGQSTEGPSEAFGSALLSNQQERKWRGSSPPWGLPGTAAA